MSGQESYLSGLSAEAQVAIYYSGKGADILAERWRGTGGEIDLIAKLDDVIVCIEVKKSKSHDMAAHRLSAAQAKRLQQTAEEYLSLHDAGLQDIRFDLAFLRWELGSHQLSCRGPDCQCLLCKTPSRYRLGRHPSPCAIHKSETPSASAPSPTNRR